MWPHTTGINRKKKEDIATAKDHHNTVVMTIMKFKLA